MQRTGRTPPKKKKGGGNLDLFFYKGQSSAWPHGNLFLILRGVAKVASDVGEKVQCTTCKKSLDLRSE